MANVCGRRTYRWPTEIARGARQNLFLLDGCASAASSNLRTRGGTPLASSRRAAMIALMPNCAKFSQNAARIFLPPWSYRSGAGSGRPTRRFSGRNVNKRAIPILSVNQFHSSATNESQSLPGSAGKGVVGGASCIAHAHWQPLPPRSCVLRLRLAGDEALILLSEVFVHL